MFWKQLINELSSGKWDHSKQTKTQVNKPRQVFFSRKIKKLLHLSLVFNNNILQASLQKHLGVTLDLKLTSNKPLNNVLLRRLQNLLSMSVVITIYKAFVRPYLDYKNILSDQTYNSSFRKKLESIQYNASLVLTWAIRDSSKEKICIKNLVLSPFEFVVGTETTQREAQ